MITKKQHRPCLIPPCAFISKVRKLNQILKLPWPQSMWRTAKCTGHVWMLVYHTCTHKFGKQWRAIAAHFLEISHIPNVPLTVCVLLQLHFCNILPLKLPLKWLRIRKTWTHYLTHRRQFNYHSQTNTRGYAQPSWHFRIIKLYPEIYLCVLPLGRETFQA
jgi:hypothetical protein